MKSLQPSSTYMISAKKMFKQILFGASGIAGCFEFLIGTSAAIFKKILLGP